MSRSLAAPHCRALLVKRETEIQIQADEKAQELAKKVAAATLEQLRAQLTADVEKFRSQLPSKLDETVECAKDMKYIRDRQMNLFYHIHHGVWGNFLDVHCFHILGSCFLSTSNFLVDGIFAPAISGKATSS